MEIKIHINSALNNVKVIIESPSVETANNIYRRLSEKESRQVIKQRIDDGFQLIEVAAIEVVEVFGDELIIFLTTGEEIETKGRLYKLKEELADPLFVQITKSSLVNLRQIQKLENSFSGNMVAYLKSGKKQSVSRRYLADLKSGLDQL